MSKLFAKFESKLENKRDYTSPYVFREYPKWVTLVDGTKIIVNDAEEEAAAIGPVKTTPQPWGKTSKGKDNA